MKKKKKGCRERKRQRHFFLLLFLERETMNVGRKKNWSSVFCFNGPKLGTQTLKCKGACAYVVLQI